MKIIRTDSPEETFELGKTMGEAAAPGDVFALTGDLGAGKTVFAQGFAAGLGVREYVTSPTFTILQVYEGGRLPLYHFDVYRITDPDEMEEIGCEEYFYGEGVSLVEWAGQIRELMPRETVWLTFERCPGEGDDARRIAITENGEL